TGDEVLTGKIVNTNFSYISQKLEDVGLSVRWGTTIGDDRDTLLAAFLHAGERADAVIVNGGLGPTVDDLSQEIAARAAGVDLVLSEEWLTTMEAFFQRRSRVMSPNNGKQAMLPQSAEILDNPIGTACGFAMDIGRARFFFTPGVPREVRRMLEEQVIPRILARAGAQTAIRLKRFHSYGLGESHVDQLLHGVEELVPDGGAKRVFRRGIVARDLNELWDALRLTIPLEVTRESAAAVAEAARRGSGASHALAVLIDLDDGPDRIDFGGSICLAIATETSVDSRRSRILGGREWVRLGACEMGLDCLRRQLQGLPVYERIDFEKT